MIEYSKIASSKSFQRFMKDERMSKIPINVFFGGDFAIYIDLPGFRESGIWYWEDDGA